MKTIETKLEDYHQQRLAYRAMVSVLKEVILSLETLGEDGWSEAPHLLRICRGAVKLGEDAP